jgi:peptidoglycan/xylan/chitin deacetylase (PgdA/CDA1 family)
LLTGATVAALVAVTPAGAVRTLRAPVPIATSSMVQSAQDLVWSVTLRSAFSPGALQHAGDRLCLLLERPPGDSVSGRLCVLPAKPGLRSPQVVFQRVTRSGPGAAHVIAATVTRADSQQLSVSFLPSAAGDAYRSFRWQALSTLADPSCVSPPAGATRCSVLFPARPALAHLHTPQLVGCVPTGRDLVYSGAGAEREIALTFDDGPWYQTPEFVTLLERYNVPATFFQIGRQIATYGQGGALERRMLADGDMIGDHTWSHSVVAGAGPFARTQIERTAVAIRAATDAFTPCLFRAPYGAVSPALLVEARSMGYTTIQWTIDPCDWALPGVSEIESNVITNARPGAIVELHDGGGDRSQTLTALPDIIMTLEARGYRFVTVTQLLRQRLIYR